MKINKRAASMILVLTMFVFAIGMTSVPASAASKTQYTNIQAGEDEKPKEKVGNYYIWVQCTYDKNGDVTSSRLKCTKSLKKKAKTLKTVKSKKKSIWPEVITNGNTIYYAVGSMAEDKAVIYKTSVKGAKAKKIKTVKRFLGLAAYYNGRIYYNKAPGKVNTPMDRGHLFSCKTSGKKARLEKKDYVVSSSYGKYMTGSELTFDVGNDTQYLYNAKSRKARKLPKAVESVIYGKTIYYMTYKYFTSYYSDRWTVKKCNLSGKNVKTLKSVKTMSPLYFGKKAAYFMNYDTGVIKKLTYKTKKLTKVK